MYIDEPTSNSARCWLCHQVRMSGATQMGVNGLAPEGARRARLGFSGIPLARWGIAHDPCVPYQHLGRLQSPCVYVVIYEKHVLGRYRVDRRKVRN